MKSKIALNSAEDLFFDHQLNLDGEIVSFPDVNLSFLFFFGHDSRNSPLPSIANSWLRAWNFINSFIAFAIKLLLKTVIVIISVVGMIFAHKIFMYTPIYESFIIAYS